MPSHNGWHILTADLVICQFHPHGLLRLCVNAQALVVKGFLVVRVAIPLIAFMP